MALIQDGECISRRNWVALHEYDRKADISYLRPLIENLQSTLEHEPELLTSLVEGENNLRALLIGSDEENAQEQIDEILLELA